MILELVQNTGWVSLSTTRKRSARSVKQEFLTSMVIMPLRVMVKKTQLQDMTGLKKIVSACSSSNLSPSVGKITSFQKANHAPETPLSGLESEKPAALDVCVTSSLHSNSLTNAGTKAGYSYDAADDRKYCRRYLCKTGITFVLLAIELHGCISATLKKTLKRLALLSENLFF